MSEAQHANPPHFLLNMSMIALETVFSAILKNDQVIALQAKRFVDEKITIKINSYIPYFDFYVQFNEHGVFFDTNAPNKAVDLDIRTTLMDLIKIFLMGNTRSIRGMRIEGEITLKDQFRDLALLFSLPKVLSDWKQWLNQTPDQDNPVSSQGRIKPLLEKIDHQRSKINSLQVELKQHKNRVRRLSQEKKRNNIVFSMIIMILSVLLMYTLWVG